MSSRDPLPDAAVATGAGVQRSVEEGAIEDAHSFRICNWSANGLPHTAHEGCDGFMPHLAEGMQRLMDAQIQHADRSTAKNYMMRSSADRSPDPRERGGGS